MNFPTCRTCIWFFDGKKPNNHWCNLLQFDFIGFSKIEIISTKFVCSSHESKNGERFINWGSK